MPAKDPTPRIPSKRDTAEILETPMGYYDTLLQDIKTRVQTARVRAALAVNQELVLLY